MELLLTITMLVSDREDTIEKCMESIKPLLDSVPSELIVVDTAGNEACMGIVRRYTDKIVRFEWCDDFAAARNAGLSKAQGAWVMYLDDDEWFEDVSEIKEFFLSGTYKSYRSAAYLTRNYLNMEGSVYGDRVALRLCRRESFTCFKGIIHEQLYPMFEPAYYMKAYVHHYGYVYEDEEKEREHTWRNIRLLTEAREKEKDNWQAGVHLLQEYNSVKEYFSVIAVARDMRQSEDCYSYERNDFTTVAVIREMEAYMKLNRYEEAYTVGKETVEEPRTQLLCKLCASYMLAEVCLKLQKSEETAEYAELFRSMQKLWEETPERYAVKDLFGLHETYLEEAKLGMMSLIELHTYVEQKEWDKAVSVFEAIHWAAMVETLGNTFHDIIELIAHTDYREAYAAALEILLLGVGTRPYICELIGRAEGEEREKVLYAVSQISSEELVILRYRLQYAVAVRDRRMAEELLGVWKKNNYSFFLPDGEYWSGLKVLKISMAEWMKEVRIHEWMTLSEALFEQMPVKDCENIYQVLTRGMDSTDIRFLHITALILEKRLLVRNMKLENLEYLDMEEVWKELYRIASLWVSCAASLYRENVFQSELQSALPERYQFAWLIFQANAVKADDWSFVRKIAEAAKTYLRMEDVCKYILRYYKTEAGGQE